MAAGGASVTTGAHTEGPAASLRRLAATASIEINVQDAPLLASARAWLPPGTRVFVSHLPRQEWAATARACAAARLAGFEPVPHLPVRLLRGKAELAEVLARLAGEAAPVEALALAGDYPQAAGPYANTALAVDSGLFEANGFRRISMAGHPEGHPRVPLAELRSAEQHKCRVAVDHGLQVSLVTQFLFEARPFMEWVDWLAARQVPARAVCGLAGPARIATLLRFALRCGVGPSIRALGAQGQGLLNLVGERTPGPLVRELAAADGMRGLVGGIHLFCFGGFLHTAQWLAGLAAGGQAQDAG